MNVAKISMHFGFNFRQETLHFVRFAVCKQLDRSIRQVLDSSGDCVPFGNPLTGPAKPHPLNSSRIDDLQRRNWKTRFFSCSESVMAWLARHLGFRRHEASKGKSAVRCFESHSFLCLSFRLSLFPNRNRWRWQRSDALAAAPNPRLR